MAKRTPEVMRLVEWLISLPTGQADASWYMTRVKIGNRKWHGHHVPIELYMWEPQYHKAPIFEGLYSLYMFITPINTFQCCGDHQTAKVHRAEMPTLGSTSSGPGGGQAKVSEQKGTQPSMFLRIFQ